MIKILFPIAVCVTAFIIVFAFEAYPGLNANDEYNFSGMVYGDAPKPYIYRQLIPLLINAGTALTPGDADAYLPDFINRVPVVRWMTVAAGWEDDYYAEYFWASWWMFLALAGFAYSFRLLLGAFYDVGEGAANGISLLVLCLTPMFFDKCSYLYDFPVLLLFTLGLLLMYRERWGWFLVVFTLGCLNKETTILLTMVYFIYFRKDDFFTKGKFYLILVLQIAIFITVKTGLFIVFRDNAGGMTQFHLVDYNLFTLGRLSIETVAALGIIALFVFRGWRDKPEFLRDALWIAVPLLVLTFFLGYIDEQRDFYELYPVVVLLVYPAVRGVLMSIKNQ